MSKRSEVLDNYCSVDKKILKEEQHIKSMFDMLPEEMIMEVFSNVNESKCAMSLLNVSKKFRRLTFQTPECMRHIKIVFKNKIQQDEIAQFLKEKGNCLKVILIKKNFEDYKKNDPRLVPFILNQTPKLEEFIHKYDRGNFYVVRDDIVNCPFSLPHLKHLTLAVDFWENFIANAKEINKLESLALTRFWSKFNQNLTIILCRQDNLKELSLEYFLHSSSKPFPSWNISKQINFKLTKFKYCLRDADRPSLYLHKFLESQVGSLQELYIKDYLTLELYELIFRQCKKLKKLTLIPINNFYFEAENQKHWNCRNLIYFETTSLYKKSFDFIHNELPKLEKIKVNYLKIK